MIRLHRTVRFAATEKPAAETFRNGYAGWPPATRGEPWYEVEMTCRGELDDAAGYLIDIKDIDRAVRETLAPAAAALRRDGETEPCGILRDQLESMGRSLGGLLETVRWRLTPYYSLEMTVKDLGRVLLRQRFDFAASHRLHVPGLSDAENTRLFGKCSRPNGHGHNYRLEPCVEVGLDSAGRISLNLAQLEEIVNRYILERFDHTHLNLDTAEFSDKGGVNPTVENIAMVFYRILSGPIGDHEGASLRSVTVWETDRTSATFEG